jgi:hypothetical protein
VLPVQLRARANVNYFSSIVTSQTFNTNNTTHRATSGRLAERRRRLGQVLDERHVRSQRVFHDSTHSGCPGACLASRSTRNERPILDSPAYFSISTEYCTDLNERNDTRVPEPRTQRRPQPLRLLAAAPLPVQEMAVVHGELDRPLRETYYSRSFLPTADGRPTRIVVDVPVNRRS